MQNAVKVVVVDDDKEFSDELQEVLSSCGYRPVTVNDPMSALDVISQTKPDVVLMDLKMPAKTGFELADELSRVYEGDSLPIIAMSGYFNEDLMPLLNYCGVKRCLKKPFRPLDVIAEIEKVVDAGEGR